MAGVILGVGRAIGETMAVIMVAGNVANMPSLLGTVKLLTTGIAMEMSYSSGLHRQGTVRHRIGAVCVHYDCEYRLYRYF